MEPKQRLFIAEDPGYQVKSLGVLTDEDLHVFIHNDVLDAVLADAAANVDKLRAGALVGNCFTDGKRRFIEVEAAVLLIPDKPPAQPFALDESHHAMLENQIAERYPGRMEVGLYLTHPRLGLYLSRSETAAVKATFDPLWSIMLVTDPVADKFTFFQLRGGAPTKSGIHMVTRLGPAPAPVQAAAPAPVHAPPPASAQVPAPPPALVNPESRPRSEQLTREELFRLATEEVFKDGQVDEEENRTLQLLGGLLRLDAETAIRLAKQARKKFRAGELGQGGKFDPRALYQRATQLALADGELEADESNILGALRLLLKIPEPMVEEKRAAPPPPSVPPPTTGPPAAPPLRPAPAPPSPVPQTAAPTSFRALLTEYAGIAFDRQVYALDRLGDHDFRWDLDAGTITLANATFSMQALGSTSDQNQTWMWAWAGSDRPLPEPVLAHARRVQSFGVSRGVPELSRPVMPLTSVDPNELAMVASGLTNAYLYYRIPFEGGALYVLVTDPAFGRSVTPAVSRIPLVFPRLLDALQVPPRATLVSYMRACGLEIREEPERVIGQLGGDRVVATFDSGGAVVDLRTEPPAGSGVRPRA